MSWNVVLDVGLVALLLWTALVWLRRSRARFALLGVAIVGGVTLLASRLDLQLTAWMLQGVAAIFIVLVVVVFQDDLRSAFEQIGRLGVRRRAAISKGALDSVVRAVERMATDRTGALIVVPGRESPDRFLEGGYSLGAWISEPLLLSIFDHHSPGHDGAVLLDGPRVSRFAVHLPLSNDRAQLGAMGTRHAAALGLAERSDAFCIIVSEERGTLSVARDGTIRRLSGARELASELRPFLERTEPTPSSRFSALRERWPEGIAAIVSALALWFLVVPGSSVVEVQRDVVVKVENLPEGYELVKVDPPEVSVTLSGERRRILLGDLDEVALRVDAFLAQLGRRTFQVSVDDVGHPEGIEVTEVSPRKVVISVRQVEPPEG
ncbi:MAG: diadenylate cyclase [Myxococcota bacterium]